MFITFDDYVEYNFMLPKCFDIWYNFICCITNNKLKEVKINRKFCHESSIWDLEWMTKKTNLLTCSGQPKVYNILNKPNQTIWKEMCNTKILLYAIKFIIRIKMESIHYILNFMITFYNYNSYGNEILVSWKL